MLATGVSLLMSIVPLPEEALSSSLMTNSNNISPGQRESHAGAEGTEPASDGKKASVLVDSPEF